MTEIIGYIAAFLTTFSFLPQVISILRTKDTSGISLSMYSIFVSGVFLWLIYGILLKNIVITSANLVTFILAGMVLVLRVRNGGRGRNRTDA
jgi:MtN3 and saliva related transmembrane protein